MNRHTVSSSNVASVGYDVETQTLEVEFQNGAVYQYYDVPSSVYEAFMSAPSHGQFLHYHIKGYYRYSRV